MTLFLLRTSGLTTEINIPSKIVRGIIQQMSFLLPIN